MLVEIVAQPHCSFLHAIKYVHTMSTFGMIFLREREREMNEQFVPCHEKTYPRGFLPGMVQAILSSYGITTGGDR